MRKACLRGKYFLGGLRKHCYPAAVNMVIHTSFPNCLSDKGYYKTPSQYLLYCSYLFFSTTNHSFKFWFLVKCYRQQWFVLFKLPIKILWHVSRVESIFFTNSFTRRKLNKRNKALQLKKRKREGSETSNLYRFSPSILLPFISLKIYLRKWWILTDQDT